MTLVIGPGDRFLSGVSYYTALLAAALNERGPVAVLLLRKLCPRAAYPGRVRVGSTDGVLPLPAVPVFNGLDWFWGRSAVRAWRFWWRVRPTTVVLQWWTCTTLHSYLVMALLAKRAGARLIVEFHEIQDVGEAALPLVSRYTRAGMAVLLRHADGVVVHSDFDRAAVRRAYPRSAGLPIEVIPHGPYALHSGADPAPHPAAVGKPLRVLTFGVIRPYKGHAELAEAVRLLTATGMDLHLTVVGEVWQGYQQPLDDLRGILAPDRLTIVDRYVADAEVPSFFAAAHLVVLPYRRCSASGPLQIAMSWGLPVVTTAVGGLVEATSDYTGAVLVSPGDSAALAAGIRDALRLTGIVHADPHSWRRSADHYEALLGRVEADHLRHARPTTAAAR